MKKQPTSPRCEDCGKFLSWHKPHATQFVPDSEFTVEKVLHWCDKCATSRKGSR